MLKRTLTISFFATIFAIGGLGIVTNAMATFEYPDPGDYSCKNFNITLENVARDHGDVFRYEYTVTSEKYPTYKWQTLEFGVEADLVVTETDDVEVFPPGQGGEGLLQWLKGVPQLQVLGIEPQEYTDNLLIVKAAGTNGRIGKIAAHTKAFWRLSEICYIDGPVVSLVPVDASVPSSKKVVLSDADGENNVEYCVDIDPHTGCPFPDNIPYLCSNPAKVLLPDDSFKIGGNEEGGRKAPTFIGDINSDPRCTLGKAAHNPCQWILLSGRAYGPVCW